MTQLAGMEAALRLLQYGCLLPLTGVLLDPARLASSGVARGSRMLAWLCLAGLLASAAAFGATVEAMSGERLTAVEAEVAGFVLFETDPGRAFVVRSASLVFAMALLLGGRRKLASLFAVLSVATLAWSGHAAVLDGPAGVAHRIVDVLHLLAAAAWLGALSVLLWMSMIAMDGPTAIAGTVSALRRFSVAGTFLVGTVLLSGIYNLVSMVGLGGLAALPSTVYGQLLGAKLLAFLGMLVLAAVNRWWITHRLDQGSGVDLKSAVPALRISLAVELALGCAVLALVAFLGMLDPLASG